MVLAEMIKGSLSALTVRSLSLSIWKGLLAAFTLWPRQGCLACPLREQARDGVERGLFIQNRCVKLCAVRTRESNSFDAKINAVNSVRATPESGKLAHRLLFVASKPPTNLRFLPLTKCQGAVSNGHAGRAPFSLE